MLKLSTAGGGDRVTAGFFEFLFRRIIGFAGVLLVLALIIFRACAGRAGGSGPYRTWSHGQC